MQEININIEGYNVNGICVGCLNYNRRMFYDNDAKEVFKIVGNIDVPDGLSIQVCWECLAAVKSVIRFQKQILNSFEVLISYSNKHTFLNSPEDFTRYSSTQLTLTNKIEQIDIIPKPKVEDDTKEDIEQPVKQEDVFLELEAKSIKQEQSYEDPYTSDGYQEPVHHDSTDEDIQLSQLKDKENRQKKAKKKDKKKKKKNKEPTVEEPPKGRKLKNLPSDIIQLYTMSEEEMHIVRANDIQSEAFTKLRYRCDDCIIGFNTEKLKEFHMNGKHKPKSKNCHQCDVCNAYFLTKENLSSHRSLHLSAFRCTSCGHVTTVKRAVAAHECAKPYLSEYSCNECDMVFSDSDQTGSENTESDSTEPESESDNERNDESDNFQHESRNAQVEKTNDANCDESDNFQHESRNAQVEMSNDENCDKSANFQRESDHFQDESDNDSSSSEAVISVINDTITSNNNENIKIHENTDPLTENNDTRNSKKSKIINLDSESEIEESFSIESRGVTRKKESKNGGKTKASNENSIQKDTIQHPEPPIQQMLSLQLTNTTTKPHNNCENCPKIDKLISLAETLHSNQKLLFNTINDIETRVLKRLDHISAKFDEFVQKSVPKMTNDSKVAKPEHKFKIITSKTQLEKLENDLNNSIFKAELKQQLSLLCPKGKGRAAHNAYVIIDALFSRKFMTECSWSGGSRSDLTKTAFRHYKNVIEFFFEIIHDTDSTYTLCDCENFFRQILRNSMKRNKELQRKSTPRNRRRRHEILLEQQLDPGAQASTEQLLGLMQAITNFENNQQAEEITEN